MRRHPGLAPHPHPYRTCTPPQVKYEPAAPVGDKSSGGLLKKPAPPAEQQQEVQQEGAAGGAEEPLFPHLYGTIDLGSVVGELPMQRGEGGTFLSIQGL